MRIALLLVLLVCLVMQARYMWDFSSGQCHNRKCMNYVKVFVLNLCVSISDSMHFQIVIQGVDLSVHTLYVSLGESVLFVSPPLLWKGCHDHPVCFLWWTYRFFSPVCSFSLGIHQIVDWATYLPTIHSLQPKWKLWLRSNHRFNCPFNFDASKKTGFVIPKTFPQFGYEMIIKKTAFFPLLILFPFWFQIPHEHCSVFCWGPVMFKAVRSVCITRRPSLNNKKLWL